jgi:excinuclease UvrABC ATPase subunit
MNPNSKLWETSVDSIIREYVNARLGEELNPIRDDIEALRSAISRTRESLQQDVGNIAGRVANAEDILQMSSTRVAQLAKLGKEKGE